MLDLIICKIAVIYAFVVHLYSGLSILKNIMLSKFWVFFLTIQDHLLGGTIYYYHYYYLKMNNALSSLSYNPITNHPHSYFEIADDSLNIIYVPLVLNNIIRKIQHKSITPFPVHYTTNLFSIHIHHKNINNLNPKNLETIKVAKN